MTNKKNWQQCCPTSIRWHCMIVSFYCLCELFVLFLTRVSFFAHVGFDFISRSNYYTQYASGIGAIGGIMSSVCPSVRLSVTLCILALRVGVHRAGGRAPRTPRSGGGASRMLRGLMLRELFWAQQNAKNLLVAGAPPRTPLGELTALPQTP